MKKVILISLTILGLSLLYANSKKDSVKVDTIIVKKQVVATKKDFNKQLDKQSYKLDSLIKEAKKKQK